MEDFEDWFRERIKARLVRNVTLHPHGMTVCWLWDRCVNNQGYPKMNIHIPGEGKVQLYAHRVSLAVFKGPPPSEHHEAAHDPELCPFRTCINPAHLRWATRSENEADKRHPSRLWLPNWFVPPPRGIEAKLVVTEAF